MNMGPTCFTLAGHIRLWLLEKHTDNFQSLSSVSSGHIKGCGMGPWLVLVSPCFMENVVTTCKIVFFCVCVCSLDNLLQKT